MKTVLLDTNALLRFLLNDIPNQADQVEALFRETKSGKLRLVVPEIVVFEIHFALLKYYKFPKDEVIDKLKSVLSAQFLTVESEEVFLRGLSLYRGANVSFVDCFLIAKSDVGRAELFSFDRKLQKKR